MNQPIFPGKGLYLISRDDPSTDEDWESELSAGIRGGAAVVQYRVKRAVDPLGSAARIGALCRAANIPFIVNDDIDLALAVGADGVHLGREDGDPASARDRMGASAIIGVSCYDDPDRAAKAQARGANYVAFGRFFPSATKPLAPCAHLDTLRSAKYHCTLPIVAIGGIKLENARLLLDAGADLLAVIEGVFSAEGGPESAARQFRRLWD
ncbi:MAG: thiamine phosphate synthase [Methylococcus sp.]